MDGFLDQLIVKRTLASCLAIYISTITITNGLIRQLLVGRNIFYCNENIFSVVTMTNKVKVVIPPTTVSANNKDGLYGR